jgi:hypothetical protein
VTDYYLQLKGVFAGGVAWSIGQHYTSNANETTVASTWQSAWADAWTNSSYGLQTLYPVATTTEEVTVATLNASMHETSKTLLAAVHPGTSSADTLPYQEAVVVSWRGLNIQRHGRGRWYLPALAEDQVNGDIVIDNAAGRIKNAITALKANMTADGSTFFVTNKKALKDGTPPFQKVVVTTPLVAKKPARMSRRTRKIANVYV